MSSEAGKLKVKYDGKYTENRTHPLLRAGNSWGKTPQRCMKKHTPILKGVSK
jgi:hypothetical protein